MPEWKQGITKEKIPPKIRAAINRCCTEKLWPLVLLGEAGCGKTCAALLLCDHVRFSVYQTAEVLCDRVAKAMHGELRGSTGHSISEDDIWKEWNRGGLCILDEVATRAVPSDHRYEVVKKAIDIRLGRPFVVISNAKSLRAIAELYDDRIASRLSAGLVCRLFPEPGEPSLDQRKGIEL